MVRISDIFTFFFRSKMDLKYTASILPNHLLTDFLYYHLLSILIRYLTYE